MPSPLTKQQLAEHLRRGPTYLFGGQAWLKIIGGRDWLLEQSLKKFQQPAAPGLGYKALLKTAAGANPQEAISWMHDRCSYVPLGLGAIGEAGAQSCGAEVRSYADSCRAMAAPGLVIV